MSDNFSLCCVIINIFPRFIFNALIMCKGVTYAHSLICIHRVLVIDRFKETAYPYSYIRGCSINAVLDDLS